MVNVWHVFKTLLLSRLAGLPRTRALTLGGSLALDSCVGFGELQKRGDGGESGSSDKETRGDNKLGCVPAARQQEANRLATMVATGEGAADQVLLGASLLRIEGSCESQAAIEGEKGRIAGAREERD